MNRKRTTRILFWAVTAPTALLSAILLFAYLRQDAIVQSQISALNADYIGRITVGDVHLAPFTNFPDISLKVDDVAVHESKNSDDAPILNVADIYVGFNILDLLVGDYDIHSLIVEDGFVDLVIHSDGTTNLKNALATSAENEGGKPLDVHLHKIELKNNKTILFPSVITHSVDEIVMNNESDVGCGYGRYAVSQFFHLLNKDDSDD